MDIYTDYANWKFENYDFIHHWLNEKARPFPVFLRFWLSSIIFMNAI